MRNLANYLLGLAICVCVAGCMSHAAEPSDTTLQRFEFQKPEMGLPFRIVLYAPDEQKANEGVAAAFKRIEQLNDIMSDYDEESELMRLSREQGKPVKVSDDLWTVLAQAQRVSKETGGAFDVTVGPVVKLWRKARREKKLPDPQELMKARASVGYQWLKLDEQNHTVTLLRPGMKLDLGGIAKGYANDQALKVLKDLGITRALVTGGGDMAAGDPPPGKKGWRIELAPLDVPDAPPTSFALIANRGFATSGDLFQHVEIDGKRYSHVVDPRTGIGLTDHGLVLVIAANCMTADSLSKPAGIMPPQEAIRVIQNHGGAVRIAKKPADRIELFESENFKSFLEDPVK